MNAAVFENVEKTYRPALFGRGVAAVRGVSLAVPAGSVFGLLGPNRAGKTTLVKLLLNLARPTAGTLTRLGEPASARRTLGRVGYMHENHAFPKYLSAAEVLHFYGGMSGIPAERLPARADALLDRVGLADRKDEPIARFSKGMVQRLGLAQAVINDPDLLVLDEPTEGLDLLGRELLRDLIRATKASGKTVLLVSHSLPEVAELCDQLAVIVGGRVAFRGEPEALRRQPDGRPQSLDAALRDLYTQEADA